MCGLMMGMHAQVTPNRTPGSGLTGFYGSDMLLDCERPQGPRKVSLKDARRAPSPKPKPTPPPVALGPKPKLSVSAAIEDALREREAEAQPAAQPAPPSDHRTAAANLWQFPEGARSLDTAAHGDWSRVSLCEPPPHMKHLINAAKMNQAAQQPAAAALPPQDCNKPWAARRSVDMRRSIAGRGIRTGAAERISGGGRSVARERDGSPHDRSKTGSPAESPPARVSPVEGPPAKNEAAREKPAKKLSFSGTKKVNFLEEGMDALRTSLADSPKAESAVHPAAASDAKGSFNESNLEDLHSIGRTLPRVRVTLQN